MNFQFIVSQVSGSFMTSVFHRLYLPGAGLVFLMCFHSVEIS